MSRKSVGNKRQTSKIWIITISAVIGVTLLFDLLIGGTIKFYSTWVSCGHMPVVTVGSGYFNANAPSYHTPPEINIFPGVQTYFCSAFDAEKHGYSADVHEYSFPVLEKNNALCQKPTDPKSETAATFSPCN